MCSWSSGSEGPVGAQAADRAGSISSNSGLIVTSLELISCVRVNSLTGSRSPIWRPSRGSSVGSIAVTVTDTRDVRRNCLGQCLSDLLDHRWIYTSLRHSSFPEIQITSANPANRHITTKLGNCSRGITIIRF